MISKKNLADSARYWEELIMNKLCNLDVELYYEFRSYKENYMLLDRQIEELEDLWNYVRSD